MVISRRRGRFTLQVVVADDTAEWVRGEAEAEQISSSAWVRRLIEERRSSLEKRGSAEPRKPD